MVLTPGTGLPTLIMLLLGSSVLTGCGEQSSPTAPSATQSVPQPSPQPTGVRPTVKAITPNAGSMAGGSWGTITGSEFEPGARVRLGNSELRTVTVQDSTTLLFWVDGPHAAGTVDVTVTNKGGLAGRLSGGYTYAAPELFDANGDWLAHAGPHYETDMRIAIRNNELVSFSCGTSATVMPSIPVPVRGGEFSFQGEEGVTISGRVVSPANAAGTVNTSGCNAAQWWADRK